MNPIPIRVVLCDDHELFRQGLSEMIRTTDDIEVVGEAASHEQAVSVVSRTRPEVVLLDLEMPGRLSAESSMQRMFQLTEETPRVIVLTMHDEPRLIRRFLGRDATAYLPKSASLEELLTSIRTAVRIKVSESGEDGPLLIPEDELRDLKHNADDLSEREVEVLLQAARGMSNRQVSVSLHISEATVKRHLANIYKKTETGSRAEVTKLALSSGWITSYEISDSSERGGSGRRT